MVEGVAFEFALVLSRCIPSCDSPPQKLWRYIEAFQGVCREFVATA